jgi:hypothetical protein
MGWGWKGFMRKSKTPSKSKGISTRPPLRSKNGPLSSALQYTRKGKPSNGVKQIPVQQSASLRPKSRKNNSEYVNMSSERFPATSGKETAQYVNMSGERFPATSGKATAQYVNMSGTQFQSSKPEPLYENWKTVAQQRNGKALPLQSQPLYVTHNEKGNPKLRVGHSTAPIYNVPRRQRNSAPVSATSTQPLYEVMHKAPNNALSPRRSDKTRTSGRTTTNSSKPRPMSQFEEYYLAQKAQKKALKNAQQRTNKVSAPLSTTAVPRYKNPIYQSANTYNRASTRPLQPLPPHTAHKKSATNSPRRTSSSKLWLPLSTPLSAYKPESRKPASLSAATAAATVQRPLQRQRAFKLRSASLPASPKNSTYMTVDAATKKKTATKNNDYMNPSTMYSSNRNNTYMTL